MWRYFSFIKFEHTLFAMPFALASFTMALVRGGERFSAVQLLWIVLCMVFARSAAMGFNRYADRAIDAQNARTANRHIPAGKIAPRSALGFVVVNCLLFVVSAGMLNPLCLYLSPVALAVVLGYSYTKRFTALCHFVLGLGLSIAPMGAWLAVTGSFHPLPLLLSTAVLFWTGGFDIIYALQDEAFDRQTKLFSLPSALGPKGALRISSGVHLISALVLALLGWFGAFGWLYWTGYALFAILLIWQHQIVSAQNSERAGEAFFTGNTIAAALFSAFLIADLLVFG